MSWIQNALLGAIKDYFEFSIQRPELLNRIGDNFVVFDFIRPEAASLILELKLNAVCEYMGREKNIQIIIEEPFRKLLLEKACSDLSNGGRGIGNMVETLLVNPLSQIIVKEAWKPGCTIIIQDFDDKAPGALKYSIS